MQRRTFWKALAGIPLLLGITRRAIAAQAESMKAVEELQKNWKTLLADGLKVPAPSEPLKLTKDEWKKRLAGLQYEVLREEGTERPGSSPLNNEKRPGVFACAGCRAPGSHPSTIRLEPAPPSTRRGVARLGNRITIARIERLAITNSGCNAHVFHYVRHS